MATLVGNHTAVIGTIVLTSVRPASPEGPVFRQTLCPTDPKILRSVDFSMRIVDSELHCDAPRRLAQRMSNLTTVENWVGCPTTPLTKLLVASASYSEPKIFHFLVLVRNCETWANLRVQ